MSEIVRSEWVECSYCQGSGEDDCIIGNTCPICGGSGEALDYIYDDDENENGELNND